MQRCSLALAAEESKAECKGIKAPCPDGLLPTDLMTDLQPMHAVLVKQCGQTPGLDPKRWLASDACCRLPKEAAPDAPPGTSNNVPSISLGC